jgi:hypothetical protein
MKVRKMFAILSALVIGGLGIAAFNLSPQIAEAGVKLN